MEIGDGTIRNFAYFIKKIGDHFVAVGCDPDATPFLKQVDYHPCAGVGLARSWRPLNGKNRIVEREDQPAGGGSGVLLFPENLASKARRTSQEQVSSRSERPVPIDSIVRDPGCKTHDALCLLALTDVVDRDEPLRMRL